MRKSDIRNYRNNCRIGQMLKVNKVVSSERLVETEVEIVEIYDWFCLVQPKVDPKYKWCIKWVDLLMGKTA